MLKLFKAYGCFGEGAAYHWIMMRNMRRQRVAPEAIWRASSGIYMRFCRMGDKPYRSEVSGTSAYTATLTIEQAFRRLDCRK